MMHFDPTVNAPSGRVHSIQSLGTVDGPGIRHVTFLQGCPLRCACCHNPDTWDTEGGTLYTPEALFAEASRCREYFGKAGGVTLSGGEPLLQARFAAAYFSLCRDAGLHTCLDTSGCFLNEDVKALLSLTDRVLLDIKYPNEDDYRKHVGGSLQDTLAFLTHLNAQGIPTTLRTVIIPGLTDTAEHEAFLAKLVEEHACIDKVECLPFKKLCTVKYEKMGISFPLADTPTPDITSVKEMQSRISEFIR